MYKVDSKKVLSTMLACILVFGIGQASSLAAPKENGKETGRTEQNVQTGVISYDSVTVPRYATEIQLSGTVVIDGPQAVVTIPGSKGTTVKKVGDKTWQFEATIDVTAMKGDIELAISAHSIYVNGKPAGSTHTSAPTVTQKIHVPYVTSTVAENTEWTAYNRSTNHFTLSYDEVENWSVGDPVVTAKTMPVSGLDSDVTVLGTTLVVPIAYQDFVFSQEDPTWEYDENTKTYSATFNIVITDSKGNTTTVQVTKTGLTPGVANTVSYSVTDDFGTITKSLTLTAPVVPVVDVVADELFDLELTLTVQNKNSFKVSAAYHILYSDGSTTETIIIEELGGNIGNPNTPGENSTKNYLIGGFNYNVTVHYDSNTGTYYATADLIQ